MITDVQFWLYFSSSDPGPLCETQLICLNYLDQWPDPRWPDAWMLSDCSWGMSTETQSQNPLHPRSLWTKNPSRNPFCLLGRQGPRGLKIQMLTLSHWNRISTPAPSLSMQVFYALHKPLLQRRISYCSEPHPATEMHMDTDLKSGSFHWTKGWQWHQAAGLCSNHLFTTAELTEWKAQNTRPSLHRILEPKWIPPASSPKQEFFP